MIEDVIKGIAEVTEADRLNDASHRSQQPYLDLHL